MCYSLFIYSVVFTLLPECPEGNRPKSSCTMCCPSVFPLVTGPTPTALTPSVVGIKGFWCLKLPLWWDKASGWTAPCNLHLWYYIFQPRIRSWALILHPLSQSLITTSLLNVPYWERCYFMFFFVVLFGGEGAEGSSSHCSLKNIVSFTNWLFPECDILAFYESNPVIRW